MSYTVKVILLYLNLDSLKPTVASIFSSCSSFYFNLFINDDFPALSRPKIIIFDFGFENIVPIYIFIIIIIIF